MATIYGDTEGTLEARAKAQTLTGTDGEINYIFGDAFRIENMRGGNDVLIGGDYSLENLLYGDAFEMSASQGGNDVITGGTTILGSQLYGDAYAMFDSQGGNDVLTGGAHSISILNLLHGDAFYMLDSQGGNDVLTGGSNTSSNVLYGDAFQMSGSRGGNDVLTGGANVFYNELYGDSYKIHDRQGGNDILIAGANPSTGTSVTKNILYGDALCHGAGSIVCGNDRLISSTGDDDMWGDIRFFDTGTSYDDIDLTRVTTGHDVFVFSANNGNDTIHDFRHGEDKIELQGVGVTSFDALMAGSHLSQDSTNSVITFGTNTITVVGVTELTAADFMFT